MTGIDGTSAEASVRLLPHQSAFVRTALDPDSKRTVLLREEVGLGKSDALIALARRLMQERPTARALFFLPASLVLQTVAMLQEARIQALLVDRYRFREMLDSAIGADLWPRGTTVVVSRDFAKQPDILESLAATQWDMVIADEAHGIRGARAEALRRLAASADRVVLVTLAGLSPPHEFPSEGATIVEWRLDRAVGHDGRRLDALPQPVLHESRFRLSQAEVGLEATVTALCHQLDAGTPAQRLVAAVLRGRLKSSPVALEGTLQRLLDRSARCEGSEQASDGAEDEVSEEYPRGGEERLDEGASGLATRALQEIEAIGGDSKLEALFGVLSDRQRAGIEDASRRVCVVTDYLATLYYLAADIEGHGISCQLLHGGMSNEDRRNSLAVFLGGKGVLVASRTVVREGMRLAEVTDLVLYDAPVGKVALQQVLGRFHRYGRLTELNIHLLVRTDSEADPLGDVREALGIHRRGDGDSR